MGIGTGNHRCIGSLFARLEFQTIFDTVLRRMPDFQVDLDSVTSFDNVGVVTSFTSVPATLTPGPKVGADPKIPGWKFYLPRQVRRTHQELIHRPCALAAFANGPDHQGLAPAHVATGEDVGP